MCYYNPIVIFKDEKRKRGQDMKYILYNPLSGHGNSCEVATRFSENVENSSLIDMTKISSFEELWNSLAADDEVYLFGGDGTLNRFINCVGDSEVKNPVYYFPSGTGNDFCIDVDKQNAIEPFLVNEYITDLPTVTVNDKEYKFINGVGFGLDGYACEIGDALKAEGKTPNYTKIAIAGLLFKFKPANATVTVDGVKTEFKKVWVAPAMYGRHYGGGMMPAPDQNRYSDEGDLSLMVFHGSSRLKTLMIFPSIFKGEHVKNTKHVTVMKGKEITVEFDRPTALQIDGETVVGVTKYSAFAKAKVKETV